MKRCLQIKIPRFQKTEKSQISYSVYGKW